MAKKNSGNLVTNPTLRADCIVIGAGVFGLSLAYHLTQFRRRVIVVEKESSYGLHTSGKTAGMVRQLYRHPQLTEWATRSIAEWPESLRKRSFVETGSLIAEREMPDHHPELFEMSDISFGEGQGKIHGSGIYTETDGLLNPQEYLKGLVGLCEGKSVTCLYNEEMTSMDRIQGVWQLETKRGTRLSAPWVINSAGAWLNSPFGGTKLELQSSIKNYARHLFVVSGWSDDDMNYGKPCGFYWNEARNWYMRLWGEGERLVSVCDAEATDPDNFTFRPEVQASVADKLHSYFPESSNSLSIIKSWFCFRTYTEDQLPIFGEDPSAPGLFWLGSFGGFGISTSFAATLDAAKYINGKASSQFPEFSVSRIRKT